MTTRVADTPLYLQLANNLEGMIESGTFQPGDRIPSVREMSKDQRVSISTVMEAYSLLEDRGRIQGRSRSGYFVRPKLVGRDYIPKPATYRNRAVDVSCAAIFEAVMDAAQRAEVVPLGAATSGDESCPHQRLASISNAIARSRGASAFHYTMVPGQEELRIQIAKRSLKAGLDLGPSEIITTTGATEALFVALKACTQPGDLVVVENPTYFGLLDLIRKLGLQAIEVPQHPETGIDLDSLAECLRSHRVAACLIQANFQNPIGSVMPDANKRILVEMCADAGVVVIEDEIFADLHFGERRPPSLKAFDKDDSVIQCSSFSKTLSAGLRVGWIAPGRHYERVKELKASLGPATCTLSELVVAEFLKNGGFDRHLRRIRAQFFTQVQQMRHAIFEAFPEGTRVSSPSGSFLLWAVMPKGVCAERIAVEAMKADISVVPGSLCSATCQFSNALRLNCGHAWDERLEQALKTLGRLAKRQLENPKSAG